MASTEPNWKRFGLEVQQPILLSHEDDQKYKSSPTADASDSDENELFQEEQKSAGEKPWWKANFFVSEPVFFGAWDGVFTSCMLNIFGIIIFLRTGWMVGNAGIALSVVIILITLLIAVLGVLSSIGICERCKIESGGVYFLISHVLGGQVAAAVGILYCFGQAVSCSMYTVGFGESISVLLNTTSNPWVARGFAIGALILLMSINLAGVKWVIRLQLVLLFTIMMAVVDFLVGSFISYDPASGVLRYSAALIHNNTLPDFSNGESFFSVFGVFFPTACGVLAGINMSGDLKEPRKAIAQGTLAATGLSGSFYLIFILVLGSVAERWALKTDYMIAEKISAIGVLWLIGLYVSSITSCMGCLYGAPRVLQSIATSNSFSAPVSYLAVGRGPNKVPIVALCLVVAISLIFICVGDVNFLAPIVTMPFLLTYMVIDYAYFSLAMTADLKKLQSKHNCDRSSGFSHGSGSGVFQYGAVSNQPSDSDSMPAQRPSKKSNKPPRDTSNSDRTADDLDQLFPERKLSRHLQSSGEREPPPSASVVDESGDLCQFDYASQAEDEEDGRTVIDQQIYHMSPSWYSTLCNRWSSLFGALATLVIMFLTQWLYSLVSIGTLAVLYVYLTYAIPGAKPGIAQFTVVGWVKAKAGKNNGKRYMGQIVVTQHSPLLSTTATQLNDKNEDFMQRRPYHLSQLKSAEHLPLCCDPDLEHHLDDTDAGGADINTAAKTTAAGGAHPHSH